MVCMHAYMQVPSSIVGVAPISYRSTFLSSSVVSAKLSLWTSLLTVALCFLQSRCFSRQRAKIFKKVCLFLGVGGSLADRLVDGVGFQ